MDFDLTEEQKIFKRSARGFLAKEYPKEVVRKLKESESGFSPERWRKMAELGWMGILFPEEYDGIGGSFLDLVLLLEEMGYNLCPSPFLATVLLGGLPILKAGSEEQKRELLPKIAMGERIVTLALMEPNTRYELDLPAVTAFFERGAYAIRSTKVFVPFAHVADSYLCAVRTRESSDPVEGLTIFLVDARTPGIRLTPMETIDHDKQFEVVFDGVRVATENIIGKPNQGGPVLVETLGRAAVARGAEMVGGAQAAMDMAMQYSKERIQFNVPIGSFQAVQNHLVNMWMEIHGARYLVQKTAWKIDRGYPVAMDVAMAKAQVGRASRRVTTLAHQVFAAISFTMEHDLHLYYRQALAGDLTFGNTLLQRRRVARELGLE